MIFGKPAARGVSAVNVFLACLFSLHISSVSARVVYLGSVSSEPTRESKRLRDFARYLAVELAAEGVSAVDVRVAASIPDMSELVSTGRVDVLVDSPFATAIVANRTGADVTLLQWRFGEPNYRSVIFVRADAGISSLAGLTGKSIAFDSPHSTGAYFLPKAALAEAGITMRQTRTQAAPTILRYRFSGDDRNTLLWVLRGKADAGAMAYSRFEVLARRKRNELLVLHQTAEVPRAFVTYRKGFEPRLAAKTTKILLSMHTTYLGKIVLGNFDRTEKFAPVAGGSDSVLAHVRTVGASLESELGF